MAFVRAVVLRYPQNSSSFPASETGFPAPEWSCLRPLTAMSMRAYT